MSSHFCLSSMSGEYHPLAPARASPTPKYLERPGDRRYALPAFFWDTAGPGGPAEASTRHKECFAMKKIYVGNLPYGATEDEVRELFASHGDVHSVKLINDRQTGRPRGFGFVEMDAEPADAAIEALNGQDFGGRSLRVNEARERGDRDRRRGGGRRPPPE